MQYGDSLQQALTDNKRHQAIQDYLFELVKNEPDLYYSSTDDVARRLHDIIQERSHDMSIEDKKILKGLSIADIEKIMSFHSHGNNK